MWAGAACLAEWIGTAPVQADSPFQNGDRVVFLGDSITQERRYTTHVECFLLTRFPQWKLTFRNAGHGSDTAWLDQRAQALDMSTPALLKLQGKQQEDTLVRMVTNGLNRDVLPLKPTVVTIMYGANDVRYLDTPQLHIRAVQELIMQLRKAKVRVILISACPEEPLDGEYNKKHERFIAASRELADRLKVTYVDQFHPCLKAILQERAKDSSFGWTRDSVHPHPQGHVLMARAILQGLGFDASKVTADETPLMAKVIEKNNAYFRRWREIQIPAILANKLERAETRVALAAEDMLITKLEAEIDAIRKSQTESR
jgi:lysophospholipase L1-like esterase